MKPTAHRALFVFAASRLPAIALLLTLAGCAHSTVTRTTLALRPIAASDLPAGWTAPQIIRTVAPEYPIDLKRAGFEEEVPLVCLVDEHGLVQHVALAGRSASPLVEPAAKALYQWRFEPGSRNGQPVSMSIIVPIRFVLEDPSVGVKPAAPTIVAQANRL
jgi:protein TonB